MYPLLIFSIFVCLLLKFLTPKMPQKRGFFSSPPQYILRICATLQDQHFIFSIFVYPFLLLLSFNSLPLSCLPSLSTIVEEEVEDLYSDSSEDELNPTVQIPVVKHTILSWRRPYNFPSPENFRHFVESPFSPTHTEEKAFPKYVCCKFFQNLSFMFYFVSFY